MSRTLVVVGGGVAAAAAIQALRREGGDERIVLVGEEPHPPYERPPLSKEFLQGKTEADQTILQATSWYEEAGVEARFGERVARLDPSGRAVELEGGERIPYDGLLLATGGRPRHFWEPSERILYLRTLEDAARIRRILESGSRLLVVGAGFIGSEVAASARSRGLDVVLMDVGAAPLGGVLGERLGRVFEGIHRDAGVILRMGQGVAGVEERDGSVLVTTQEGEALEGDAAVVGVGIIPRTELAEEAGLDVENGVLVDAALRTSADGVIAAGDVANHDHPLFGRLRIEHFDNALKQGAHAGRVLMGATDAFDDPHWFWSDQYEHNLQMIGINGPDDDLVVRGSLEERRFTVFFLREGILRAALALNRGGDVRRAGALVSARARPDPDALADPRVDLRSLRP